ncbi:MAG: hypothetical protein WAT70_02475 [Rhizobiaceae bacterium]
MALRAIFATTGWVLVLCAGAAAAEPFVAGLLPDQRPPLAPRIVDHVAPPEWRQRALHGIGEPIPPSLRFLDDQGAWFTPFDHPGMPGRYDIRGWHGVQPAN